MSGRRIERGDRTREKLLIAAVDVFGRVGFDGATTRMLAETAGANQHAIAYYFDSKEGLYLAAATFIADGIKDHITPLRTGVFTRVEQARAGTVPLGTEEARRLLTETIQLMAALFASRRSEPWARFIIREQIQPTTAFSLVYDSVMGPLLNVCDHLVGTLLAADPASEHVRLRTLSLLGSVLMFRMAHASVLAALGWKAIDDKGLAAIEALVVELVASIAPRTAEAGGA
jgi:AcrR family transcriptional regulator